MSSEYINTCYKLNVVFKLMKDNTQKGYFKFITEYIHDGNKYGSSIFAKNKEEAEKQLQSKRETERILGYDPTKVYL